MCAVYQYRLPGAIAALGFILACAHAGQPVQAATMLTWSGSNGTWNTTSTNWPAATVPTPWDTSNGTGNIADFSTAGITPTVSGTISANGVQFDSTASISGGTINLLAGNLAVPAITVSAPSGTIGSTVIGTAGMVKSGTGLLTLTAANTLFTGGTTISQGTLQLNASTSAGPNTQSITLGDVNTGANNFQLNLNVAVTNPITVSGLGSGVATINALGNIASFNNAVAVNGPVTITSTGAPSNPAPTFALSGSSTVTFSVPTAASTQFIPVGNNSNFTGNIIVASPTVFEPRNSFGTPLGNNVTILSGATMNIINFGNTTINALNGSGTVKGRNAVGTLTVGIGNGSGTFSGAMQNGATVWPFVKSGTGTQTLSGANITYTGATTLSNGTLNLTNAPNFGSAVTMNASNLVDLQLASTGSSTWTLNCQLNGGSTNAIIEKVGPGTLVLNPATGSTFVGSSNAALTVTAGALYLSNNNFGTAPAVSVSGLGTFGGNGTVAAATVAAGGGIVGGYAGAGALTMNSLTFSGSGSIQGTLAASTTPIVVNGAVTTNGANTIGVSVANLPANGIYNLLSYGSGTDPFSALKLTSPSRSLSLVDNSASQLIQVNVNLNTYPIWTGLASSDWSLATEPNPKNWQVNTGGATDFLASDTVVFDDSVGSAGTTNVTINNGNVNPGSVSVNNNLYNYTFSGSNGITTGALTKNGTGTLTINTANSFGGGTTLNAGTLIVGNNAALGSGTLGINGGWLQATGGAITLSNSITATADIQIRTDSNSLALNGTVTGNNLIKSGTGMLTLASVNTLNGIVTVSQGTLQLNNVAAAGTAPINLGDANTGNANIQLTLGVDVGFNNTITVANQGSGTTIIKVPDIGIGTSGTGLITLNSAATIDGSAITNGYYQSQRAFSGSGTLTYAGAAGKRFIIVPASPSSSFTGDIVIQSGIFEPRNNFTAPGGNNMTVNSGAELRIDGGLTANALNGAGLADCVNFGAATLTVGVGNGSGSFNGTMKNSGNTFSLTKTGTGTQELSGANIIYTGATTLTQGTLRLTNATGFASAVAMDSFNNVDLQLNNTSGTAWTFSQQINGGATNGMIEKIGPGTVVLNPASGSTFQSSASTALTVTAGALYLTNTNLNSFSPPAVVVAPGGTFGGNSTVGAVTIANGGGIVGGYAGAGALTMNSLTFSGSGTAAGLLTPGTPPIVVKGSVTASPASIAVTPANLPNAGTYPFLSYTGTDPFSEFTLPNPIIGRTVLSLVDSGASNLIALSVTTSAYPVWTGLASGDWSLATEPGPKNWRLNSGGATDFLTGDTVVFDDSVGTAGTTNVTINNGNVNPGSTTFSNNIYNYTLSGSNGITTGSLSKGGTGTLTINAANSYAGGTTINAGTLILGSNSALGGGPLLINGGLIQPAGGPIALANNVNAGGDFSIGGDVNSMTINGAVGLSPAGTTTVTINGTGGVAFANTVTGNALVKSGTGVLTLTGGNSFSGGLTVNQGTLAATFATATLGGGTNPIVQVNGGAALNLVGAGSVTSSAAITLAAGSTLNLSVTSAGNSLLSQPVEVTGNAVINLSHLGSNYRGNGFILDSSTPVNVTVNCSGSASLAAGWLLGGDYGYDRGATGYGVLAAGSMVLFNGTSTSGTAYGSGTPGSLYAVTAYGRSALANTDLIIGDTPSTAGVAILLAGNNGGTFQVNSLSGGSGALTFFDSDNFASTIQINNGTTVGAVFAGTIGNGANAGTIALVKSGTGTQVLTGDAIGGIPTASSTFNGGVTVNDGTLVAAAVASGNNTVLGNATSSRTITVNAGGTLEFVAPNALGTGFNATNVPTLAISGGTVTNAEPGAPYPAGQINNALNNVSLTNGELTATTGQHGGYAAWNINGTVTSSGESLISTSDPVYGKVMLNSTGTHNTTFNVTDGTLTISAPLVQDNVDNIISGLTLTGGGTMVLSATNTYMGGTTVANGTLIATSSEAIADGTSLAVGDPSLLSLLPAAVVPTPAAVAQAPFAPVPEPGSMALLAAAAITGIGIWRKKGPKA
jgi:autotransporter-associated beta strand protein